jgi:hypothetical protein
LGGIIGEEYPVDQLYQQAALINPWELCIIPRRGGLDAMELRGEG